MPQANEAKKAPAPPKKRGGASGIKKRWFANSISVILVVLALIAVSVGVGIRVYYYDSVQAALTSRAMESSKTLKQLSGNSVEFYNNSREMMQNFSDHDKMDMQILSRLGQVEIAASGLMAGFVPETDDVVHALGSAKEMKVFTGHDPLTNEKVMACTAPVINMYGTVIGAVRYVTSLRTLDRQIVTIYLALAAAVAVISAMVIISNGYFIRTIVNPILKINQFAQTIAGGHYGAKLDMEFDDEIGELGKTLNNMSQELARMEKLKNDFISSVSHELRTPLTAINGWAETVAHDLEDPAIASAGLDIIKNETARLSQMVEEMLDFSRMESGGLRLQTEEFDIRGQLYDAVFTYTEMLKSQGLGVRYEEPDDPIILSGDKHRLKQVFLNIIDNAAKYGNGGQWLDVSVQADEDFCTICIRDYGQGIPEKELPFVKEKFFKGSARGRGTGIGLSVCNEIVEMHGGRLDVESTPGEGTAVNIFLPMPIPPEAG